MRLRSILIKKKLGIGKLVSIITPRHYNTQFNNNQSIKGQNPSLPLSVKGKRLIHVWYNVTYLPTRSLIHEPLPIILVKMTSFLM
jgi:hypothetical protein